MTTYSDRQILQALAEPFLPYKIQRKWPDGLATNSVAYEAKDHGVLQTDDYYLELWLFPGRDAWFLAKDSNSVVVALHGDRQRKHAKSLKYFIEPESRVVHTRVAEQAPVSWRPVTYGMKLTPLAGKGGQENAGWFMAKRMKVENFQWEVVLKQQEGNPLLQPTPRDAVSVFLDEGMLLPLNYISWDNMDFHKEQNVSVGAIKDLGNDVFVLNQASKHNSFLKSSYQIFDVDQPDVNYTVRTYNGLPANAENTSSIYMDNLSFYPLDHRDWHKKIYFQRAVASAFDVIYVLIVPDKDTKILATTVAHQELLYDGEPHDPYFPRDYTSGWIVPKEVLRDYRAYASAFYKSPNRKTALLTSDFFKNHYAPHFANLS